MINELLNIVFGGLGFVVLVISFIDQVALRPKHKKELQKRFKKWWKIAEHYDKIKLALACADKANNFLDDFFGPKLLSKKLILRCVVISSSVLLITMSWVGLTNGEIIGLTPWNNYESSVKAAEAVMDNIIAEYKVRIYVSATITNATPFDAITNAILTNKAKVLRVSMVTNTFILVIETNTFLVKMTQNADVSLEQIEPLGHGFVYAYYDRRFDTAMQTNVSTNLFGAITRSKNPYTELQNDAASTRSYIAGHDKIKYIVAYCVAYFIILFLVNSVLFVTSLALCRIMLREIVLSSRWVSIAALVVADLVALFCLSCVLLLLFTILAIPILWLVLPSIFSIASQSLYTFFVFISGVCMTLWVMSGTHAKLVALIALLPNVFAGVIGLLSVLAVKWKNAFHFLSTQILIRCAESSPIVVLSATILFITGLIALVAKYMHLTSFL